MQAVTTCRGFRALYLRASGPTRTRSAGRNGAEGPVIDHWWQTGKQDGRSPAIHWVSACLPVKYGSRHVPSRLRRAVVDDAGHRWKPARSQCRDQAAFAARLPARLWNAITASMRPISRISRLLQNGGCRLSRREEAISSSWRGPTDIINVADTGCRRGHGRGLRQPSGCRRMRRESHRRSPQGQVPAGFLVINANVSRETEEIEKEVIGLVRERIGPGRRLQERGLRQAAAKDAIRQDPALYDPEDSSTASPGRCRRRSTIRRSSTSITELCGQRGLALRALPGKRVTVFRQRRSIKKPGCCDPGFLISQMAKRSVVVFLVVLAVRLQRLQLGEDGIGVDSFSSSRSWP